MRIFFKAVKLLTLFKSRITNFYTRMDEIGRVVSVGYGLVRIYVLKRIEARLRELEHWRQRRQKQAEMRQMARAIIDLLKSSSFDKVIDSQSRATIGRVSNRNHGARKIRKAGQRRWLGRRPIARGVAMNPPDDGNNKAESLK